MRAKVIIADDNPLIRESLRRTVNWEEVGCELVGEAENGIQEKKMIRELHPDIIVSDIRMPGLDGLKIAEHVKASSPGSKVIIITGYSEFEYAQRALKLGVFDFVLKPISNGELEGTLAAAAAEIAKEREASERLGNARRLLDSRTLWELACGQISPEEVDGSDIDKLAGKKYVYVVGRLRSMDEEKCLNALETVKQALEAGSPFLYVGTGGSDTVEFLCAEDKKCSAYMSNVRIKKELQRLYELLDRECGLGICFCVSSRSEDIGNVRHMRKQAVRLMEAEYFTARETTLFHYHYSIRQVKENDALIERIEQFQLSLGQADEGELAGQADGIIATIEETIGGNEFQIKCILSELCMIIHRHIFTGGTGQGEYERDIDEILKDINLLTDMGQARAYMQEFIRELFRKLAERDENANPLVRDAVRYIKNHYSEDKVSLTAAADSLNVNSSYLSRLFKKETGMNFIDYLTNIRIQAAKRLLNEPGSRAAEVGLQVGYRDYSYFYQVFRKVMGVAPTEYRKSGKKTNN